MAQKIVVVGAGIGGLVAAGYLAAAGHSVQVLEAGGAVGGRCLAIQRGGFTFHPGTAALSGLQPDMPLGTALDELGLSVPVYEMHGEVRLACGKRSATLETAESEHEQPDVTNQNADNLGDAMGPALGAAWQLAALGHEAVRAVLGCESEATHACATLDQFATNTGFSLADITASLGLGSEPTPCEKALLEGLMLLRLGAPASAAPAFTSAQALAILERPLFLPPRGVGELMGKLNAAIEFHGGDVALHAPVTRLTHRLGNWTVHQNEKTIDADCVILAVPPHVAATLVDPADYAELADYLAEITTMVTPAQPMRTACLGIQDIFDQDARMLTYVAAPEPLPLSRITAIECSLFFDDFAPEDHAALILRCATENGGTTPISQPELDEILALLEPVFPGIAHAKIPVSITEHPALAVTATPPPIPSIKALQSGVPTGITPFPGLALIPPTPGIGLHFTAHAARHVARELLG